MCLSEVQDSGQHLPSACYTLISRHIGVDFASTFDHWFHFRTRRKYAILARGQSCERPNAGCINWILILRARLLDRQGWFDKNSRDAMLLMAWQNMFGHREIFGGL